MSIDSQRALAARLVQKHGRAVSVRTNEEAPAPNEWDERPEGVYTTVSTYAVLIDTSLEDLEARIDSFSRLVISPMEITGTLMYIAASTLPNGITKVDTDVVDADGIVWRIKQIEKIQPGTLPILYILGVEK